MYIRLPEAMPEYNQQMFADVIRALQRLSEDIPAAPAVPDQYTTSNVTTTRTIDADATTLAEVADVLCSLIEDLKSAGYLR